MPHRHNLNKLDYNYVPEGQPLPDPTTFRIQASQIADFFDHTSYWYAEKLLGAPSTFKDSSGSVIGTVVHYLAECKITTGVATSADVEEAMKYVALKQSDTVDQAKVESSYMASYHNVKRYLENNPVALAEPKVHSTILPSIIAGGSIDAIRILNDDQLKPDGSRYTSIVELRGKHVEVIDWKTHAATNTAPSKSSKKYQWQLLVYAFVLERDYGIIVDKLTNVYITHEDLVRFGKATAKNPNGAPLKPWPSLLSEVNFGFTKDDYNFIESLINLVADSVHTFQTHPELRYILAQDYRLKNVDTTDKCPIPTNNQPTVEV